MNERDRLKLSVIPGLRWLLLLLAFASTLAPAQTSPDPTWSEEFNRPGLVGRVFAVGEFQGELIAAGHRFEARGTRPNHVARFDGSRWQPLGEGVSGRVRALAVFDGELVVAGEFSGAGGQAANSVAAWNGSSWRPLGQGLELSFAVEARVFALEVFQGELYAGGEFDIAGGQPTIGIARWDGTSWRPVAGGIQGPFAPKVLSLHADPVAGVLYVGGEFETAGGTSALNIARWDGADWSQVGPGIDGPAGTGVHALQMFQGAICAGGNFTILDQPAARRVACYDGVAWQPLGLGIPDWDISVSVHSLTVFDGSLFVGGNFIEVDGEGGVFSRAVARWDGSQWHSVGGIDGSDLATTAIAMTVHDGRLIVGGEFKWAGTVLDYGSASVSWNIAGYTGSEWQTIGDGLGLLGPPMKIIEMGDDLIAVGAFFTAGDQLVGRAARLRNGRWETIGVFDREIDDAVMYQGEIVAVGNFTEVDGQAAPHSAVFDGTSWRPFAEGGGDVVTVYQGQLHVGGLGGVRRWNGSAWESFGPQLFGQVSALHVHTDGRLWIGGNLGSGDGVYDNIAAWDGSTMDPLDGGADNSVGVFYSRGNELLIGGSFRTIGGVPAVQLAAWDGSGFREYGGGIDGVSVDALIDYEGQLLVGGNFTRFWGHPADFLLRETGSGWEGLGTLNGFPRQFLVDSATGALWVSGTFSRIDDVPTHGLTRFANGAFQVIFSAGFE